MLWDRRGAVESMYDIRNTESLNKVYNSRKARERERDRGTERKKKEEKGGGSNAVICPLCGYAERTTISWSYDMQRGICTYDAASSLDATKVCMQRKKERESRRGREISRP